MTRHDSDSTTIRDMKFIPKYADTGKIGTQDSERGDSFADSGFSGGKTTQSPRRARRLRVMKTIKTTKLINAVGIKFSMLIQ